MSIFKRIFVTLLGASLFFAISPGAKAVPVNVTFVSSIASFSALPIPGAAIGDSWTLSFVVDNGSLSLTPLLDQTWDENVNNIVGSVTGTAESGYSATYGTNGIAFSLTTDLGGVITNATFQDTGFADNVDVPAGTEPVHTTVGPVSGGIVAFLTTSTTDSSGWSVELADVGGGNVPEPGTLALFGIGLVGLTLVRRRRRSAD